MRLILKQVLLFYNKQQGGFSQADPESGTLYDAAADGTIIWTVEQPASPDYLDQLRGGFRVQDLSSNGLGTVQNGWEWQLERQANNTWTFSWYSVTGGAKSAAIQTQTNIGTVVNVRVILDANSLAVATSADGENYTARGSTTSATYQTETGISASYIVTDGFGSELAVDGTMTASVANWPASGTPETREYSGGRLHIVESSASFSGVRQAIAATARKYHRLTYDYEVASGSLRADLDGGSAGNANRIHTGTGSDEIYHQIGTGAFALLFRSNNVASEFYVDNASCKEVLFAPDASGDGGFSQVVQS